MAEDNNLVLRASRRKWGVMATIGLVVVVFSVTMVTGDASGFGKAAGWAVLAFFGLGSLVAAIQLVKPDRLILAPTTLMVTRLGRATTYALDGCSNFRAHRLGATVVVFDYTGNARRLPAADRRLFGAEFGLPDTYGMKPDDLAALLNAAASDAGRSPSDR